MIGLLQRLRSASVDVSGDRVAAIDAGLLVLVGVEAHDDQASADALAQRIANYRVFADDNDKMNLSTLDCRHAILAVPQFTLVADTARGRRPSFSRGAPPELGKKCFTAFVSALQELGVATQTGVFGADMQVSLCNDGPVTFWLQTPPSKQ